MLLGPLASAKVELSFKEVLQKILENDESLKKQNIQLSIQEIENHLAKTQFLPSLDLLYTNQLNHEDSSTDHYDVLSFKLNHSLLDFYNFKNIDIESKKLQWEKLQLQIIKNQAYQKALQLYYDYVRAKLNLNNSQQLLSAQKLRQKELEQRVKIGRSKNIDLFLAKSQVLASEADYSEAQRLFDHYSLELKSNLNLKEDFVINNERLTENISLDAFSDILSKNAEKNEYLVYQNEIEISDLQIEQQEKSYFPKLNLNANYYAHSAQDSFDRDWDASLVLSWNLFNAFSDTYKKSKAIQQKKIAHYQFSEFSRKDRLEIENSYLKLQQMLKTNLLLKQSLGFASQAYNLQKVDFSNGLVNILDLNSVELSYWSIKKDYENQLVETNLKYHLLRAQYGVQIVQ